MASVREQRLRQDPAVVHRDVTISRDTRDALEDVADFVEERFPIKAGIVRDVIARWDANGATEIYVTEDGIES